MTVFFISHKNIYYLCFASTHDTAFQSLFIIFFFQCFKSLGTLSLSLSHAFYYCMVFILWFLLNSGFATICFCCCSFLLFPMQVFSLYVCFYMRFFLANNMSFFYYILCSMKSLNPKLKSTVIY